MSSDLWIYGFVPPDEKWKQMKSVWDACEKANVKVPAEVGDFFGWTKPSDDGKEIELNAEKFTEEGRYGFILDVDKIPKNVNRLRFYLSY